jgi:hypothetical protein
MLTITQLIGIIIAVSLTAVLLIIGYQIILILKELHKTATKINQVTTEIEKITKSIAEPVISLSGFLTGLKDGAKIIKMFTNNNPSTEKKKFS